MNRVLSWVAMTVALVLVGGLSVLLLGLRRFNRLVRRDIEAFFAQADPIREAVVTEEVLNDLPVPVQRYFSYTGVVGKPLVSTVHLKQKGAMHLSAEGAWIPLDAVQYYTVQPPGFVWDGTMHVGPFLLARARDRYTGGTGHMLVRAGSLVTVVNGEGEEMDQGAMMRYLSEMMWFPTAFLGDNISFRPVDDKSAQVQLTDHGRSVTGTMYYDEEGRLTDFVAKRYRMVEGGYDLETWSTPVIEYGELAGLKLPVRGKAVWKLPDGDLEYIDITITELEYNAGRQ